MMTIDRRAIPKKYRDAPERYLKQSYVCKEMHRAAEELRSDLNASASSNAKTLSKLRRLEEFIDELHMANDDLLLAWLERSELVTKQVASGNFDGVDHNAYHINKIALDSAFSSVITKTKTILNHLTTIWHDILPRDLARGIKVGSFGRFLTSIENPQRWGEEYEPVRSLLATLGRHLDQINNDYRDRHIEHPASGPDNAVTVFVSDAGGVMRLHVQPRADDEHDNVLVPSEGDPQFVVQEIPGYLVYHIHCATVPGLDRFTNAEGVTPIGLAWDGGTGHFAHWREHSHRYHMPRPGQSDQVIAVDHVEGTVLSTSPRSFHLTDELESFLLLSFQAMRAILSPDARTLTIDSRFLAAAQNEPVARRMKPRHEP